MYTQKYIWQYEIQIQFTSICNIHIFNLERNWWNALFHVSIHCYVLACEGYYKCQADNVCIDQKQVCDLQEHCSDGADEADCCKLLSLENSLTLDMIILTISTDLNKSHGVFKVV